MAVGGYTGVNETILEALVIEPTFVFGGGGICACSCVGVCACSYDDSCACSYDDGYEVVGVL